MKKIFLFGLIFLISLNKSFSQQKTVSIKLEDKKKVTQVYGNEYGDILVYSARQPSMMLNLFKDNEVRFYDKNLNLKYFKKVNQSKNIIAEDFSYSGKYLLNFEEIIDKDGNSREYPFTGFNHKETVKNSKLNPIFRFFNNYGYTIIGPEQGRENRKKIYGDDDLKIFNLRNSDLREESFTLELAKIETNRKVPEWYLGRKSRNSFFLTSTDIVEKNTHTAINHFTKYNYDGSIRKYTKVVVNLDENKYFLFSHNNGPVYHSNSSYGGSLSYSGTHVDNEKNTFLVYGYYSNSDGKQVRVGKVDGIYAFKFNQEGDLLWKNYYPFSTTKKGYLIKRMIQYNECNGKGVIHSYIDDNNLFFSIDSENGSILSSSNELVDFFHKGDKMLEEDNFLHLNMYVGGYFRSDFKDKKTNNNIIISSVFKAMILKPEIKKFILNRASSVKKATYDAYINKTGEIIITEILNKNTELNLYMF